MGPELVVGEEGYGLATTLVYDEVSSAFLSGNSPPKKSASSKEWLPDFGKWLDLGFA